MKDLQFIEGSLPKGFKPDFESFLFNEEPHRRLQSLTGWHTYHLVRADVKRILATLHIHQSETHASSPHRAPFGSIEFSKKLSPKELYEFLLQVEVSLQAEGVRKIKIKNPPDEYRPALASLLNVLLLNLGYRISEAELGAVIVVDKLKYDTRLEAWEKRKLNQGKKAKLRFLELPESALAEVYNFIEACRLERQQSLSMSLTELESTIHAVPGKFHLFAIYQGKELAAASITIRISKKIVYNFYSAHPRKFDNLSPVVSLISHLYSWGQKNGVDLIDLGTSALEGKPNFGLLDFKLRLSGNPTTKFTFEKDL